MKILQTLQSANVGAPVSVAPIRLLLAAPLSLYQSKLLIFEAGDDKRDKLVTGVKACSLLFQAEDGIRDKLVTGVQTCALPISISARTWSRRFNLSEASTIFCCQEGARGWWGARSSRMR